ncbi:MAG: acyl--CoA ligase [Hyphomonadaceae bacterium]|nr:acyl--CoA ligase [Hyphomonadaceae bacterium]
MELHTEIELASSLGAFVRHWADTTPNAIAYVEGDRSTSYAGLDALIDTYAGRFSDAGATNGARILALVPPSGDFLASLLGAERAGAVWVGVNPKYTPQEVVHVARETGAHLALVREQIGGVDMRPLIAALEACGVYCIRLDGRDAPQETAWAGLKLKQDGAPRPPQGVSMFVFTSGTTGAPKAAMVKTQAMATAAKRRARAWGLTRVSLAHYLPVNHIGGASDIIGLPLATGGTLVFLERFSADGVCAAIETHRLNALGGVPASLQLCSERFDAYDLSSLERAMFSGGRAPASLLETLGTVAPRIVTSYGMTESVASITISEATETPFDLLDTVGHPTPDFEMRLSDGETGEIQVRGPTITPGYWNAPEKTAAAFTEDGFYKTGDLARRLPDGQIQLTGRASLMFKSGGYNVYPQEVEQALEAHPGIAAAIVAPAPDQLFGEVGIAFVLAKSGSVDIDIVQDHLKARLAGYKRPKQIFLIDEFPTLANGKVDRQALAREAADRVEIQT